METVTVCSAHNCDRPPYLPVGAAPINRESLVLHHRSLVAPFTRSHTVDVIPRPLTPMGGLRANGTRAEDSTSSVDLQIVTGPTNHAQTVPLPQLG
jgi:hypothetical protein